MIKIFRGLNLGMSNYFERCLLDYFRKIFARIAEIQFQKEWACRNLIFKKKQVRIKELENTENKDEAKRKARSYFNFFKRIF